MSRPSWGEDDVMEEHFNHPDSSTYSVSGSQLKYQRKKNENLCVKLYVSSIPADLSEAGLRNIFFSSGLRPIGLFISGKSSKISGPSHLKWGFVEFKSTSEAQSAIINLNKKPPYHLGLTFARSEEDKLKLNKERNGPVIDDSFQQSPSDNSMGKGRGKLPPMQGRSPSSFKSNYPEEEMYLDDFKQKESLMNSQFSHPDDSWKTAASNSVFSPLSDGVYDNGQRMMSMGRGAYTSNNKQQPQQQKLNSTPEIPKEKYRFEDVTEELDTKVAAYISKRFRDLSCNSNYKLSTEMQLSLPFKLGQCAYCSRPSIYACSRCKAWYCCNSCRVDDYPQHKKICTPKKIIFDPAGNITFVSEPDEFASALEPPTVSEPPEFTETNSENGGFNTSYDCNSSQTNRSNDSNRENHRGNYKKERTSDSFNNKEQNQKNRGQGGGGQRINNRRSGGDRDQSNNHMDRSRGGANKGGGGGGKDRRSLPNRNQNMENNVYVRKTSMSPERVPNNKPQINDKILPVEPPLPHTKFSQVRVGALGQKKGEFWAYSMSNEAKQAEILMRLNQHCAEAPPIPYVEPGMLVCAPFDGDRYRGRVIKIDKSTSIVDIFFIDFGNLTSVKAGELCQMPSEIEAIPPLAHHFILGNSLDNPTIVEEETIKIKPVKQDLEGRWVVHLEGVPYSDTNFQEVYYN